MTHQRRLSGIVRKRRRLAGVDQPAHQGCEGLQQPNVRTVLESHPKRKPVGKSRARQILSARSDTSFILPLPTPAMTMPFAPCAAEASIKSADILAHAYKMSTRGSFETLDISNSLAVVCFHWEYCRNRSCRSWKFLPIRVKETWTFESQLCACLGERVCPVNPVVHHYHHAAAP
jgi:hypothetical protein